MDGASLATICGVVSPGSVWTAGTTAVMGGLVDSETAVVLVAVIGVAADLFELEQAAIANAAATRLATAVLRRVTNAAFSAVRTGARSDVSRADSLTRALRSARRSQAHHEATTA
jgi:hypothetical protein